MPTAPQSQTTRAARANAGLRKTQRICDPLYRSAAHRLAAATAMRMGRPRRSDACLGLPDNEQRRHGPAFSIWTARITRNPESRLPNHRSTRSLHGPATAPHLIRSTDVRHPTYVVPSAPRDLLLPKPTDGPRSPSSSSHVIYFTDIHSPTHVVASAARDLLCRNLADAPASWPEVSTPKGSASSLRCAVMRLAAHRRRTRSARRPLLPRPRKTPAFAGVFDTSR